MSDVVQVSYSVILIQHLTRDIEVTDMIPGHSLVMQQPR